MYKFTDPTNHLPYTWALYLNNCFIPNVNLVVQGQMILHPYIFKCGGVCPKQRDWRIHSTSKCGRNHVAKYKAALKSRKGRTLTFFRNIFACLVLTPPELPSPNLLKIWLFTLELIPRGIAIFSWPSWVWFASSTNTIYNHQLLKIQQFIQQRLQYKNEEIMYIIKTCTL